MASYSASTEIARPPEVVFPYLTDPELLRRWLGGFRSSRSLSGDGEEPRVGARSIDTIVEGGREMEMETEILRYEPPRELDVRITGPDLHAVSAYRLSGAETTTVTHTQEMRLGGLARLLTPFLRGTMEKRLREDLARLKAAAEGAPEIRGSQQPNTGP